MDWRKDASIRFGAEGGGKVRIKIRTGELGLSNLELEAAKGIVSNARAAIARTIGRMAWPTRGDRPELDALMALYFFTDPAGATQREVNLVMSKLELAMNGMNGKINLKLHPDPQGAHGYVNFVPDAKGLARGLFLPGHNVGTVGAQTVGRGDIHLGRHRLGSADRAVVTFIHEAMHKYASLADHDMRGQVRDVGGADDGSYYIAPGLTKAEALNNADSYGWFCYFAGDL